MAAQASERRSAMTLGSAISSTVSVDLGSGVNPAEALNLPIHLPSRHLISAAEVSGTKKPPM